MSARQLTVLGTSSQVPTRHRNHNGLFLAWDGCGLLVDPGEGTQRQMLRFGVAARRIHRIALTHLHGDHCLGLPGVLQRLSLDQVPHPVHLHHARSEAAWVDRLRRSCRYVETADIRLAPHDEPGIVGRLGGADLLTAPLDHRVPTWGWRVQEPDSWVVDPALAEAAGLAGPDIGRAVREGKATGRHGEVTIDEIASLRRGQSVAFVLDTRPCEGALSLARDVDLLVCESTYLSDMRSEAHERGHMTAADAALLAQEANAGLLVLTQFSQRYPDERVFEDEARPIHERTLAAHDGIQVDLPRRRASA